MDAVLIAGPTASGKTAHALTLAHDINGAIINCDSMQVYVDLNILSARPTAEEMASAPHHLFGHVDGSVRFSAGRYFEDAKVALEQVQRAGKTPIFVGGTGLYFKALLDGLSPIPDVPADIFAARNAQMEAEGAAVMHHALAAIDPQSAAQIRASDRQRVLRALCVYDATGRSLSSWQSEPGVPLLDPARCDKRFLDPDREALYARINARFVHMVDTGALDEVRSLMQRNLDPTLPVMRAHGVPHLIAHLSGDLSLDEAVSRGQADTRHYAKRQVTWFRGQMTGWQPFAV